MSVAKQVFVTEFREIVACQPNKIALLGPDNTTLTYLEFNHQIEQACNWLSTLGLKSGDRLMVVLPNAIETAVVFLASVMMGYVYAPLPCASTADEIKNACNLISPKVCFISESISTVVKQSINVSNTTIELIEICHDALPWTLHSYNHEINFPGGGQVLLASSGATGASKGMLLDGDRLWSSAKAFLKYHNIQNADLRVWNYLPMSYLGGLFNLLLIPLAGGGSIYVDETFNGRTFLTFWQTVNRFEINTLWLVPTILRGLLTLADKVLSKQLNEQCSKINHCFIGTAPVSSQEKQKFHDAFGIQPLENYGLSETTFISSERIGALDGDKAQGVGKVMPDVDIKLKPMRNREDKVSQIWVRTPYMMIGYSDVSGFKAPLLDSEGFWYTGDLGHLSNGNLILSGRERDIIKKGGILIELREIELLTEKFFGVAEAVAVKKDHAFYGESYDLYIRTLDSVVNINQFKESLNAWLCEQVIQHKWPDDIIHMKTFPMTSTGKVKKHGFSKGSIV
ncbi:MAG: class I adenylate-forming enzyme family protein [Legionella sp.]|nr:class I adenylate-forming enzyme family protein [Legionella sp.]